MSINDKDKPHNTRAELSKELGWSTGKTAQAEQVLDDTEICFGMICAYTHCDVYKLHTRTESYHFTNAIKEQTPFTAFKRGYHVGNVDNVGLKKR